MDETVCFKYCPQLRDYATAAAMCEAMGLTLASIESETENGIASALSGGSVFWIGLDDRLVEGTFRWLDGATSSYRKWSPGRPDNYLGSQDCTFLNPNVLDRWDDDMCYNPHHFMCKVASEFRYSPLLRYCSS